MITKLETKKRDNLCEIVRNSINKGEFEDAKKDIVNAMCEDPHDARPHNLMGILMEHENNHSLAMKHFRAAWDLDSTYIPARFNIVKYTSFGSERFRPDAYDSKDCVEDNDTKDRYKVVYDNVGVGHVVRR